MDLQKVENALIDIFGENNVKSYAKGFRIIIDYENMPYCVILRVEQNRLMMDKDAIDQDEDNYEEAYKKAYKILLQNKDKFDDNVDF